MKIFISLTVSFVSLLVFLIGFVNHVPTSYIGVACGANGYYVQKPGWHLSQANVSVIDIPTTPIKIDFPSNHFMPSKIVVFNEEHVDDFVEFCGAERLKWESSTNLFRQLIETGKEFPFLTIKE